EKNDGKEAKLKKLMSVKPRSVSLSQKDLVKTGRLESGQALPLVVEADRDAVDLADWASGNLGFIKSRVLEHGAALFRNFHVDSIRVCGRFPRPFPPALWEAGGPPSPPTSLGPTVYTSTDHPADQYILLHNEQSYTLCWPMKLWFFCVRPAD